MLCYRKVSHSRSPTALTIVLSLILGFMLGVMFTQNFYPSVNTVVPNVQIEPLPLGVKTLNLTVHSGRHNASIIINDKTVVSQVLKTDAGRGLNILILSPSTGQVLAREIYDTYTVGASKGLLEFLANIHDGRIIVIATKDDVRNSLSPEAIAAFTAMGSQLISSLKFRGVWAFVGQTGPIEYRTLLPFEKSQNPSMLVAFPDDIEISLQIPLKRYQRAEMEDCKWGNSVLGQKRFNFCQIYDGYGTLCKCDETSLQLPITAPPLKNNKLKNVPLAIMTGTRAKYLYKCLKYVLSTMGADPSMIIVMADGLNAEVKDVADLMGVKFFHHESRGGGSGRICYHYQQSLTALFDELFPLSEYAIIMEEDLQVAPDFFSFFSQTIDLMKIDKSIYCISAWNDQCYKHTCQNESMLYRVQTMPGLGWLLSRSLYKKELEPVWPPPEKKYDWDMWMRMPQIRKQRECIIPDVSRTFHFGASGLNVNYYFQEAYFNSRLISNNSNASLHGVDRMVLPYYESDLHATIVKAQVLDHSKDPCDKEFFPTAEPGQAKLYVVFYAQSPEIEKFANWLVFAKCLKIWDLDVRGFHNSLFRLWVRGNHILFIGTQSPYAVYMPSNLKPIDTAVRPKKAVEAPVKKKIPKEK
eukprot:Sdes_comp19788_c0_seq1m11876